MNEEPPEAEVEAEEPEPEEEEGEEEPELDISSEDLEAIAVLYDQIRAVRRQRSAEADKVLAEDFDRHLKEVMFQLQDSLKAAPVEKKPAFVARAKAQLYDICFSKAEEHLVEAEPELGSIF
jgi:hypothetical protein